MVVKLFILGLPGSGKTTLAHHIIDYVERYHTNWFIRHVNDYEILFKKFEEDTSHELFHATRKYKGFIVKKKIVYDDVLKEVEQRIQLYSVGNELALIEFVRSSYDEAFEIFSHDFVHNSSYFLLLETSKVACKRRISERADHPLSPDDHYVPGTIFKSYRKKDYKRYIASGLKADYEIDERKIKIINNGGQIQDIIKDVEDFLNFILVQESKELLLLTHRKRHA